MVLITFVNIYISNEFRLYKTSNNAYGKYAYSTRMHHTWLLSHVEKNVCWGCVRTESWGEGTDLRSERENVTQSWRNTNNVWHHNFYYSPNIVTIIESKGWDGQNIWHACETWNAHKALKAKPEENLGVDGKIVLKWILEKLNERMWTKLSWFGVGTNTSSCERDDERLWYMELIKLSYSVPVL
jgi:hypothetical protein